MTKNKKFSSKFENVKFYKSKNFWYYLIAPVVVLLLMVILLSTVGFNLGTDFTGATTFKVYTNNETKIVSENVKTYDLTNSDDKDKVYEKITNIVENNGGKVVRISVSSINIPSLNVSDGQAVEVFYQTGSSRDKSDTIRKLVIQEFGYQNFDKAVSSFDKTGNQLESSYVIALVSAIIFAMIVAMIYMGFRFDFSSSMIILIQTSFDIFLTLGILSITRLTVNLSLSEILLSTMFISILNIIYFYVALRENSKKGKFENLSAKQSSEITVNEISKKKLIINMSLIVVLALMSIFVTESIRQVSLGVMISLIVTFYTSTFIIPSLWAVFQSRKKKQKFVVTKE